MEIFPDGVVDYLEDDDMEDEGDGKNDRKGDRITLTGFETLSGLVMNNILDEPHFDKRHYDEHNSTLLFTRQLLFAVPDLRTCRQKCR